MNHFFAAIITVIAVMMPSVVSAAYLDAETGEIKGDISGSGYNIIFTEGIDAAEDSEPADESFDIDLLGKSDDVEIDYSEYYGRSTLAAEENGDVLVKIYDAFNEAVKYGSGKEYFTGVISNMTELTEIIETNFLRVIVAYENDHPEYLAAKEIDGYSISFDKSGVGLRIKITLMIDGSEITDEKKEEIAQKQEEIEAAANEIIRNSGINKNSSDYEKAILLHDYLAYIVEYDHKAVEEQMEAESSGDEALTEALLAKYPDVHNAYGALIDRRCVCDGYAKAYQYLLYKVGILSHIATGYGGSERHAWNLVKLDGDWYYTDLTWDDQDSSLYHSYFDITTEQLKTDHYIDESYYDLPECTATLDNYFVQNEFTLDVDGVAGQFENSLYATIYAPDKTREDILNWYKSCFGEIQNRIADGRTEGNVLSSFGGEYHLILYKNNVMTADKEGHIILTPNHTGNFKILQMFYDENNILIGTTIKDVALTVGYYGLLQLHPDPGFDGYKRVKYMLWDSVNGLRPIGNSDNVNY